MTVISPYIHSRQSINESAFNWLVALVPLIIWSIFMFGARVVTLCALAVLFSLALDYPIRRYIFKLDKGVRIDVMTPVYSVLAVLMMPVTAPLWLPAVSSILVVFAKNVSLFRPKRLFNPFVFSAAVLNFAFPSIMTAFTKPFAYFSPFTISLDPVLVENYRVISPLQYIADGSVYEDGLYAQFYGFASGNMGEIAVCALILSLLWLVLRKEADWVAVAGFLCTIFALAYFNPSNDAESNHYAASMLLSGGIAFLSVFALCEKGSVPFTSSGRLFFALVCGAAVFYTRTYHGGFEWGYCIILAMNLVSPLIEKITKPKPLKHKKVKNQ